jgi:hypothetical protein
VSELVGVMLVDARFDVYEAAEGVRSPTQSALSLSTERHVMKWAFVALVEESLVVAAHSAFLAEFAVAEHPSPAAIDTAIAQAYDAFCLQYDLWRRASHIEWLPVLPMSLGVEPGQRSGTWTFTAAPAPKATSPEGQRPDTGRKQKQHGKTRKDRPVGEGSARKRSKRG